MVGRQQIVKINKVLGQKRKIVCEVPQVNALGPLFFILYTNDKCNLDITNTTSDDLQKFHKI